MTLSSLDNPRRVVDAATGLPSITALYDDFKGLLGPEGVTIIYVHMAANTIIEERYGWETLEAYHALVNSILRRTAKELRIDRDVCIIARAFADDYLLVAPHRENDSLLSTRLATRMNRHVQVVDEELAELHEAYIGYANVKPFAKIHPERLLYRGIQQAQMEATDTGRQRIASQLRLLDYALSQPDSFHMLYQPLVRLEDHSIFAYESLARCSVKLLRNPHILFNVAEQGGRIWPLSRILRRKSLEPLDRLPENQLLFINLHPADFSDPDLLNPDPLLLEYASRIVLEVTERAAIGDVDVFKRNLAHLREMGLRIAIDDLGSGYAALNAVAEANPDFIKFDMTLIRDIEKSPIRQNLVRNMVHFAEDAKCEVVAEGVETREELEVVRELGCHYVQGFYFARPSPPFITEVPARTT